MPTPINLEDKLNEFDTTWSPHTVAVFNGHDIASSRPPASSCGITTTTPTTCSSFFVVR